MANWVAIHRMGWSLTFELLTKSELPQGFDYPSDLYTVIGLGHVHLDPWTILSRDAIRTRLHGMRQRYPSRVLVPFANRSDSDDVACFDVDSSLVRIIHDFASPGWELREQFSSFRAWFHSAIDDMLDFE